jgi:L-lactate dehydrogenase (cytochrome)
MAVNVGEPGIKTTVLGHDLSCPILLGPVGYSRLMHPAGEIAAASAAGKAGTIFALSTVSGHALEKVKEASAGPVWYQLYLMGGRPAAEAALDRAARAGYSALVVTVDTPIVGMRERDVRNGVAELLTGSPFAKLPYLPNVFAHPGWLLGFLRDGGVPALANVVVPGEPPMKMLSVAAALARSVVTWADMDWIRAAWRGPILVKGVLTGDDARRALDVGAAGVIVSNHGGRQLDGAPATLRVLPEIVAAVNGQAEVLMDGGIRRGSDVAKALALGARAVLVGRAYAYGLAAAGEAGVTRALALLTEELRRTLRLVGCPSTGALDRSYVNVPAAWLK